MIWQSLVTIITSLGFGIIFNIRGKKLVLAAICGGLGWFTYLLSLHLGLSELISLFISSITMSIYSEIFARILKTPVTTLIVPALIPLVPGAGMYYTIIDAILGNLYESLTTGLQTLAYAGALAIGIILVSSITKQIASKKRDVALKN